VRFGSVTTRVLQAAARELVAPRREHPFAAPTTRRQRALGLVVYYGFVLALVGSILAAFGLNFKAVSGAGWAPWAQLAVGVVLIVEGVLVVSDWRTARRLLLRRLYERFHGRDAPPPPRLRLWTWKLFGQALVLLGVVWITVGAFETAQAVRDLV
jgi:hypothetical protein